MTNNESLNDVNNLTSKLVFEARKSGGIGHAYNLAIQLVKAQPNDEWNLKALAWCLIDLIKREAKVNDIAATNHYFEQLESIRFTEADKIITDQIAYVKKLTNPANQEIQNAMQASKAGNHQQAINLYKKILQTQPSNLDIKTSLGWELYKLAKKQITFEKVNVGVVKALLNDYLKLGAKKPSLLHSLILGLGYKLLSETNFSLLGFCKVWGIENLRDEDFEPYVDDTTHKSYPSLASRIAHHATKQAVEKNDFDFLRLILPVVDRSIQTVEDPIWLELYKAKALNILGDYENSFQLAIEVTKRKIGDYWSWELLGDIQLNVDKEKAFNCYCRALSSEPAEKYITNLRLKIAMMLEDQKMFSEAKYEIDTLAKARVKEGWALPERANQLQQQPWYSDCVASANNDDLYRARGRLAEEILFQNLPWLDACIGPCFSRPDNPKKKRRKLYVESPLNLFPAEIMLPESRFNFDQCEEGDSVMLKGEFDDGTNRFIAYQFSLRENGVSWDIFPTKIGVIDHVNITKKLVHVIFEKGVDTVISFAKLTTEYSVGDVIAAKLAKSTTKHGTKYRIVSTQQSNDSLSTDILKSFEGSIRVSNGLGFTDADIFIDRNLVDQHHLKDNDNVSGKAVLNYNQKRLKWGWKAILLN